MPQIKQQDGVYKKLDKEQNSNDRCALWDKLYQNAINNKVPNSPDILSGLLASIQLLSKENIQERLVNLIKGKENDQLTQKALWEFITHPLANNDLGMSEKEVIEIIKIILDNANGKIGDSLIQNIYSFPTPMAINIIDIMIEIADQPLKSRCKKKEKRTRA